MIFKVITDEAGKATGQIQVFGRATEKIFSGDLKNTFKNIADAIKTMFVSSRKFTTEQIKQLEVLATVAKDSDQYKEIMSEASDAVREFASANDFSKQKVQELATAQKTAAATSATLKAALLNLVTTIAITLVISGIVSLINKLGREAKEAQTRLKELADKIKETQDRLKDLHKFIAESGGELVNLSRGVDSFGRNIGLTNEEFQRYVDLSNQAAELFPSLKKGYTEQGNVILDNVDSVEKLNNALEDQIRLIKGNFLKDFNKNIKDFENAVSKAPKTGFFSLEQTKSLRRELLEVNALLRAVETGSSDYIRDHWDASGAITSSTRELLGFSRHKINTEDTYDYFRAAQKNYESLKAQRRALEQEILEYAMPAKESMKSYLYFHEGFSELSSEMQSLLNATIDRLDWSYISDTSSEKLKIEMSKVLSVLSSSSVDLLVEFYNNFSQNQDYIVGEFIDAYDRLMNDTLLKLPEEYRKAIQEVLNVEDLGSTQVELQIDELVKLTGISEEFFRSLTVNQLRYAYQLRTTTKT
ncbi:MAG: hypothetical protein ACOX8A_10820, partial [Thermacetogeniaceae bacterium]